MSSTRAVKWADVDEDDSDEELDTNKNMFETKADDQGIKLMVSYEERDSKMYKVSRRVKQTKISSWTNTAILERKTMRKFGKAATNSPEEEKRLIIQSEDDIPIELSKKMAVLVSVKDEMEDKFYEESLNMGESMNQVKKTWTEMNRLKTEAAEPEKPKEPEKPTVAPAADAAGQGKGARTYVPPSLRGGKGGTDAKGKGKDGKGVNDQEASLRVFNLSEDVKDNDLRELFGGVGRLARVFLAKDDMGYSRGFAFITYHTREDAQKAIKKLNGFGFDNLILQVQFAAPRQ